MSVHFECSFRYADKDSVLKTMAEIADKRNIERFRGSESAYYFSLCEGAYLELHLPEETPGQGSFYCQGTPAGPGAHAAAAHMVDLFAEQAGVEISDKDETGYFKHRDFERLRSEHYYPWLEGVLKHVIAHVREHGESDIAIGWAPNNYRPPLRPGCLLSHMGWWKLEELAAWLERDGIEPFAREFFIWNNREQDALMFRNTALSYLWKDCFFKPSDRSQQDREVNGAVLALLEAALRMDPAVPFPKKEYLELCALDGREPAAELEQAAVQDSVTARAGEIGFRRGPVTYFFGNQGLTVPGGYISGTGQKGNSIMFYDAEPENWHGLTIWPTPVDGLAQNFDQDFFAECREKTETFENGQLRACIGYLGRQGEGEDAYYTVLAEVISPMQVNFLSLSFRDEAEKDWAYAIIRGISVKELEVRPDVTSGD